MKLKWTFEKLQEEALKYKTRGEFQKNSSAYSAAYRKGCLNEICSHMSKSSNISKPEQNLFDTIKSIYPKTQKLKDSKVKIENKPYISGFDIDIYIPELRKGIEFDGKYWHSADGLKRSREHWPEEDLENYHKIKDDYFLSKGIQILHIKEEDWLVNEQTCMGKCLNFLLGE